MAFGRRGARAILVWRIPSCPENGCVARIGANREPTNGPPPAALIAAAMTGTVRAISRSSGQCASARPASPIFRAASSWSRSQVTFSTRSAILVSTGTKLVHGFRRS